MRQSVPSEMCSPNRHWRFKAGAALLVLVFSATLIAVGLSSRSGLVEARLGSPQPAPASNTAPAPKPEVQLFRGWDRVPDVALVLSAQMHGYLNPCGCSEPQYGGLPRRYNFIQGLKDKGWPVLGVDLGDLREPPAHRGPQSVLKYVTAMKALDKLGYIGVNVGQYEGDGPLLSLLGEYSLNSPTPRVLAGNLKDRQTNFANLVGGWVVGSAPDSKLKVGVAGIVGPSVQDKMPEQNPPLRFATTIDTLNATLKELQQEKAELHVLLYQGSLEEARACAEKFRQFHIVLCQTKDPEPPANPERVGDTLIVNVGHKGRYVGVVGAYRTGNANKPFDLKYQLVQLGPEYETKPGTANPALALLEAYTKEVKEGDYLAKYPRTKHPVQVAFPKAQYVGSEECKSCHRHAYDVWANHPHMHAYETLEKARNPSLRQFDGECVVCHVVGFGFETGFESKEKSKELLNVGCESCHGPGSLHVDLGKKTPPQMLALMNPYKPQPNEDATQTAKRLLQINLSCQKCHDIDNDVHWDFEKKWPKVIHRTPK